MTLSRDLAHFMCTATLGTLWSITTTCPLVEYDFSASLADGEVATVDLTREEQAYKPLVNRRPIHHWPLALDCAEFRSLAKP